MSRNFYVAGGGSFARAPYAHNQQNGSYNMQGSRPVSHRKRTGSKSGTTKHGKQYVTGWNVSRQNGLVTFLCTPYSKTKTTESKSGTRWQNWMCKVSPKMGQSYIVSCMYDMNTKRVIIADMAIVINPKTDYCGTFIKRKRR